MSQPILLSSCAQATSAQESAYRIQRPIPGRRGARVIALDPAASEVVAGIAGGSWNAAHFLSVAPHAGMPVTGVPTGNGHQPSARVGMGTEGAFDLALFRVDASLTSLSAELAEADVALMVATSGSAAEAADAIGRACFRRGIMTAGLILGDRTEDLDRTLQALRPHAQVLMVTQDESDVAEMLTALRG